MLPAGAAFYGLGNRHVWQAMVEMHADRRPIDVLLLCAWMKNKGTLDAAGGYARLSELPDKVGSEVLLEHYAEIMLEKYRDRLAIQVAHEFADKFQAPGIGSTDEVASEFAAAVEDLPSGKASKLRTISDILQDVITFLEQRHSEQAKTYGLPTGLYDLDRLTGGMAPGQMLVIAGRPSMGKTSLVMQIAEHVAVDLGKRVLVFSLETGAYDLLKRMVFSRARASLTCGNHGKLDVDSMKLLALAMGKISKAPLLIEDGGRMSLADIEAKAKRAHLANPLALVVVDYLQLVKVTGRRYDNRASEVGAISIGLKSLAMELRVPVLVTAQLNREVEKEKRKPRMADLRESGQIEQDADFIGMIYSSADNQNVVKLNVVKQRNGPTGELDFYFHRDQTRFDGATQ
jgi:replicative DNA helicase